MTINEMRDRLVEKYPGRTICVDAACWHHPHAGGNTTTFKVTFFAPGDTHIEQTVTVARLAALPDALERAIAIAEAAGDARDDEPATAMPEESAE